MNDYGYNFVNPYMISWHPMDHPSYHGSSIISLGHPSYIYYMTAGSLLADSKVIVSDLPTDIEQAAVTGECLINSH